MEGRSADTQGLRCSVMDDWLKELCCQPRIASMEFTLDIGCKLNCEWCPQDKLVAAYGSSKRSFTTELFRSMIEKLPEPVEIHFSGMSEPLLNPEWVFMTAISFLMKRRVKVFTTLWGANWSAIDYLCSSPLAELVIHLPSSQAKERLKLTEEHYWRIKHVLETPVEAEGLVFNCDRSTPQELLDILDRDPACYRINRAGNLPGGQELNHRGPIECARDGQGLCNNVVLPDGRVLLCCMDYSMQHVIGNLVTGTYDSLEEGRKEIRAELNTETSTTLCRKCHLAVPAGSRS